MIWLGWMAMGLWGCNPEVDGKDLQAETGLDSAGSQDDTDDSDDDGY